MAFERKRILSSLLFLVLLGLPVLSEATHLVGGNLRYEYLGMFGGQHRFKVVLTTYVNCGPNSQIPFPETSHEIGVYNHDKSNPNADKPLYTTINVVIQDTTKIEPNNPSNCSVGDDACIRKGVFEGTVDVPSSFDGYHLYFHRCCRNGNINNLANPGGEATSFHAYIPPTPVENSSPDFSDDPVPFICVGDTTTLLNSAVDPDGDQLVFSFEDPYSSATATSGNPNPPPPDPLGWPIPPVDWAANHGVNQPFGPGGYAYINASNGLTEYMIPNQGRWVVTVEIKEYRNGDLIGISRRDLQLLAIDCPNNPSPELAPGGSGQSHTIQEGDSLCFPIEFHDPNGDSLGLTAQGPVFDSTQVNPDAEIDTPAVGDSTVDAQFCWGTACGQGRALPYQFSVSATDSGCPPKTTDVIYDITVEPPEVPPAINGPDPVCAFEQGVLYTIDSTGGYTYDWSVSGGSISGGNGADSVLVDWGPSGTGTIEVHGINQNGCPSDSITRTLTINALPSADAGNDTVICLGDSVTIGGSPTGPAGSNYDWDPGAGLSDSSIANPNAFPGDTTEYIVEVNQPGACSNHDTVTVNVSNADMEAQPDTSICIGDTAQLLATGADSLAWQSSYALSDSTIPDPIAYPDSSVDYGVYLYDSASTCELYDTVSIQVDSLPFADAGNDTTICHNDTALLGGSPTGPSGSDYQWGPSDSVDIDSIAAPSTSPEDTLGYGVMVTDTNGCQASDSVMVNVLPGPTADAGPNDTLCVGDSVQLNGSGGSSYVWTPGDSLSDSTIANPYAFPNNTTFYHLTVTDTNGCSANDSVRVAVDTLPPADAGPDLWLCPGDSLMLDGSGGQSYAWTPADSLTDSTLEDPLAFPSDTTEYIVNVTDSNGCSARDTMTMHVNDEVPVNPGTDDTISPGDSTMLGGSPTSPTGTGYSWTPSASLDNDTVPNPMASPDTTTTYVLNVANDTCTNADSVTVYVDTLPSADAGPDQEICAGDSTQLSGSGGVSYDWTPSSSLDDSTLQNPTASPSDTTDYVVTVTGANGCSAKDTTIVEVNPYPNATAGPDTGICRGDTLTLTASGGTTYQWDPTDSLSAPNDDTTAAFPDSSTNYQVTVTDTNGCSDSSSLTLQVYDLPVPDAGQDTSICIGDSASLQASGGNTYAWSPGSSLSDSTIADPNAGPSDSTQYVVNVSDTNGCSAKDSIRVNVDPLPNVDAGNDTGICIYDSTQLDASGASSYTWTPGDSLTDSTIADPIAFPDSSITYVVTGVDSAGCSNTDSMQLTIHPRPPVDAGSDKEICRGDTVTLNGSGADTYVWSPDTMLLDPSISDPEAWPDTTRLYVLEGSDTNNCVNTDTVEVAVYRVNAIPDTSICRGDSVQLQAFGPNTTSYSWSPSFGLDDPNVADPMAGPDSAVIYTVTGTDINGCQDQDSVEILTESVPDARLSSSHEAVCKGHRYAFEDQSLRSDSTVWIFEQETFSGEEASYTYPYGNNGSASIIAVNNGKCKDTSSIPIEVPPFEAYFEARKPNVFTPNGDGTNDMFWIKTNGAFASCTELRIYNRWGQLIFKSSGNSIRWTDTPQLVKR
ncbi:MAG: gliding motility-associated C-terminal domain-containing protein [Flavobacteriales bacterium]